MDKYGEKYLELKEATERLQAQLAEATRLLNQESQNTGNIDNQMEHEYGAARTGDAGCQHQHPGRGQYGISRTDLTLRPCAEGTPRGISHEQRGRLAAALAGEWMAFEPGGAYAGRVFFQGLHALNQVRTYRLSSSSKLPWMGSLVYRCNGERILAWLDGDTLTWGDGDVYQRAPGQALSVTCHLASLSLLPRRRSRALTRCKN